MTGQWLRMCAAFAEDLSLIPGPQVRSTQLFVILGPGDPPPSFVLCGRYIHKHKHTQGHTYTHHFKNIFKIILGKKLISN